MNRIHGVSRTFDTTRRHERHMKDLAMFLCEPVSCDLPTVSKPTVFRAPVQNHHLTTPYSMTNTQN